MDLGKENNSILNALINYRLHSGVKDIRPDNMHTFNLETKTRLSISLSVLHGMKKARM